MGFLLAIVLLAATAPGIHTVERVTMIIGNAFEANKDKGGESKAVSRVSSCKQTGMVWLGSERQLNIGIRENVGLILTCTGPLILNCFAL